MLSALFYSLGHSIKRNTRKTDVLFYEMSRILLAVGTTLLLSKIKSLNIASGILLLNSSGNYFEVAAAPGSWLLFVFYYNCPSFRVKHFAFFFA